MRIGVAVDEEPNDERALIERALGDLGRVEFLPADASLPTRLATSPPDIVLNLARGHGAPERRLHVPAFLEFFAIPYSGSDSVTHATCVARGQLKATLTAHGVPTASYAVVRSMAQLAPFARRSFPVAIHRERGHGSCFATRLAHDFDALQGIASELLATSPAPIVIERFLPGASLSCAILGNGTTATALQVLSVPNDPHPATSAIGAVPLSADGLAEEVEAIALRAFQALGCRDVARVDIRLSDAGVPNVCAVDANPPLLRGNGEGLLLVSRAAGLADEELVQRCLLLAAARCGLDVPHAPLPPLRRRLSPPRGVLRIADA